MKENYRKDLARYRMQKASDNLSAARQNYQLGNFQIAISLSFYSVLTAMRALLALKHLDSHRQEGVITLFHKHFVHEERFPKHFNRLIKRLKSLREDVDYGDFVEVTQDEAAQEMKNAEEFLRKAEEIFVKMLTNNSMKN